MQGCLIGGRGFGAGRHCTALYCTALQHHFCQMWRVVVGVY